MAKKVILIILGVLLTLCGLGFLCGGSALLAIGGTSGRIQSGFHQLSTSTVALVSDPAHIENSSNVSVNGGGASITVNGSSPRTPVFLGVGRATDVGSYLTDAPYELVTDLNFSPYRLTTRQVPGAGQPAIPSDQAFWVAKASGTNPSLTWKVADGYQLVIMNANATPGVAMNARLGIKAPVLGDAGIGALVGGIVVALIGIALLIWGFRTKRFRPGEPVYPGYPPPGGYPPGGYPPGGGPYPYPGGSPGPGGYPYGGDPYGGGGTYGEQGPYPPPPGAPPTSGLPGNPPPANPPPGTPAPPPPPNPPPADPAAPGGWQPPPDGDLPKPPTGA